MTEHIVETPIYPSWATHVPVLWKVLNNLEPKRILEFGAGKWSTPLFQAWSQRTRCGHMVSETNDDWKPTGIETYHPFDLIELAGKDDDGMAFIDCEAELRGDLISAVLDNTGCRTLVVHDTESENEPRYHMARHINRWPYGLVVKCPYHHVETVVVTRAEIEPDLATSLRRLHMNKGLHRLGFARAQIFWRTMSPSP